MCFRSIFQVIITERSLFIQPNNDRVAHVGLLPSFHELYQYILNFVLTDGDRILEEGIRFYHVQYRLSFQPDKI